MARRKRAAKADFNLPGPVDEAEWEDWWALRAEMGKRLGGRDAMGVSDPEVLDAARRAKELRRERRT